MHDVMQPTPYPSWVLTHEGYDVLTENAVESRFALGNGSSWMNEPAWQVPTRVGRYAVAFRSWKRTQAPSGHY
jgi:hypothetical protein